MVDHLEEYESDVDESDVDECETFEISNRSSMCRNQDDVAMHLWMLTLNELQHFARTFNLEVGCTKETAIQIIMSDHDGNSRRPV